MRAVSVRLAASEINSPIGHFPYPARLGLELAMEFVGLRLG